MYGRNVRGEVFMKFRIFDIQHDKVVTSGTLLMTDEGKLCMTKLVHKKAKDFPPPVRMYEVQENGSLGIDLFTGFQDSKGTDIYQKDIFRVPNKDVPPNKDAINTKEFSDFVVDFDDSTGQWLVYLWVSNVLMKYGALYKYATKGTIVGRERAGK